MATQIIGIPNILRMFNARPPDHIPTAVSDARVLRFHIAILRKNQREMVGTVGYCEPEGPPTRGER